MDLFKEGDYFANYQRKKIFSYPKVRTCFLIPLYLLLIQIFGHYGLFLGHSFFVEDDVIATLFSSAGNIESTGWRSDIGLGFSSFYADPAVGHAWSLFRWWHSLFTNQILTYNISIFIFLWLIAVTHHILLKRVFPELNSVTLIFLASLVSFGCLRNEFIFLRHLALVIIVTPLIAIIILDHLEKSSVQQYFLYTCTLFFTLFLGSASSLLFILIFSGFFFLSYIIYHWDSLKTKEIWIKCKRFVILNFFAGLSVIILGAWIFYSIFLEKQAVDYIRDPVYQVSNFFKSPDIISILSRIFGFLHSGLISHWDGVLGINQIIPTGSWANVAPIFPLILVVCFFFKSQSFWEFSAKFVVVFSFLYIEIMFWFPGVLSFIHSFINLHPPYKIYPFIHTFQVLLIGFFIQRIGSKERNWVFQKQFWITPLAIALSLLYGFLLIVFISVQSWPYLIHQSLGFFLSWFAPTDMAQSSMQIIENIVAENIRLLRENWTILGILFCGTTFIISLLFITQRWVKVLKWKSGLVFASMLLINNIFLSWFVYPLNEERLIWDKQITNGVKLSKIFKKTDRISYIGSPPCRGKADYFTCVQTKFIKTPFGAKRHYVGYRLSEAPMELSGMKTHSPKDQAFYLESLLRHEKVHIRDNIAGAPRYIQLRPNLSNSKVFDLNAVNYLYSENSLPKSDHLKLVYSSKQIFLYKNNQAWPYFYLADKIKSLNNIEELYNAEVGTAYLVNNLPPLNSSPHKRKLKPIGLKSGSLKFQYESEHDEFLVILDAWHPLWRATINGHESKVFKANGTFKGVVLPSGQGTIHLFFDHSNYLPGIWITLIAGAVFILGWVVCSSKKMKRLLLFQTN